jgi:protein-L-isoaspartate(D-aspartate) O-methyltransferase
MAGSRAAGSTRRASWAITALLIAAPACSRVDANDRAHAAAPAAQDRSADRRQMVDEQIVARGVRDARVLEAMRKVPRHAFVPAERAELAYVDSPLPIGHEQTISQPFIVALMTELLALEPGDKVLEVGTGSGYQAAVLAELVREVYSIEIVEPLARRAAATLRGLGYERVHVRAGDGYRGWPEVAPFDAIVVTAAPGHVPAPLKEQLAVGGRLVIPVGESYQELRVITRRQNGYEERSVIPVRFVPMTGEAERR